MNNSFQSLQQNTNENGAGRRVVSEASVLFADIVGFVALSRRLGDAGTCDLLDQLFSEFDVLCSWHGVEKVKTIGDGYMAVAGARGGQDNHAERVARLALDLQSAAASVASEWGVEISLRIGIATGQVTVGQMGLKSTGFDVFGNTVNFASRLEGAAGSGGILVAAATKRAISNQFILSRRGEIDIRGFGSVAAWTLHDERDDVPAGDGYLAMICGVGAKNRSSVAA